MAQFKQNSPCGQSTKGEVRLSTYNYIIPLIRVNSNEILSYEHNITGARTADLPVETLGGILADDMGLGKTLTVLSTILRTAHMSKCHAEGTSEGTRTLEANENSTNQILSRATLVIVPSSRMWDLPKSSNLIEHDTDRNSTDRWVARRDKTV